MYYLITLIYITTAVGCYINLYFQFRKELINKHLPTLLLHHFVVIFLSLLPIINLAILLLTQYLLRKRFLLASKTLKELEEGKHVKENVTRKNDSE